MKFSLKSIWQAERKKWRNYIAKMQTRGFWVVNVVWFAAGGIFFSLLPHPKETGDWLNDLLAQTLIIIILAPIYWTLVQDVSDSLNRLIDTVLALFKK